MRQKYKPLLATYKFQTYGTKIIISVFHTYFKPEQIKWIDNIHHNCTFIANNLLPFMYMHHIIIIKPLPFLLTRIWKTRIIICVFCQWIHIIFPWTHIICSDLLGKTINNKSERIISNSSQKTTQCTLCKPWILIHNINGKIKLLNSFTQIWSGTSDSINYSHSHNFCGLISCVNSLVICFDTNSLLTSYSSDFYYFKTAQNLIIN